MGYISLIADGFDASRRQCTAASASSPWRLTRTTLAPAASAICHGESQTFGTSCDHGQMTIHAKLPNTREGGILFFHIIQLRQNPSTASRIESRLAHWPPRRPDVQGPFFAIRLARRPPHPDLFADLLQIPGQVPRRQLFHRDPEIRFQDSTLRISRSSPG